MLISKTPGGIYKLSREAILAAELPSMFTSKANWRGSLPRDILCMFSRQHRLSEPVFSPISSPLKALSESSGSYSKDAYSATEEIESVRVAPLAATAKQLEELFKCEVKLLSKSEDLIILCSPKDQFKKQNDAMQNACLKLLSWLNEYFRNINIPFETLYHTADSFDIQIHSKTLFEEFAVYQSVQNNRLNKLLESTCMHPRCTMPGYGVCSLKIEGSDSGVCPCNGSIPCISYSVSLVVEGENMKELLEVCDEFEFEIGVGAVITCVEWVVMQMSVGQSACFTTHIPTSELILASTSDSIKTLSLLSSSKLLYPVGHISKLC